MSAIAHHALLALAILALAGTALRGASRLVPEGLARVIAAAVMAVSLAVVEALVLGLAGLGSNTIVLATAAAATFAAAAALLPAPAVGLGSELAAWWRALAPGWRTVAAAAVGVGVAWVLWQLRHPSIGYDSAIYHDVEVAGWIHNGHPGSILALSYDIPYGNYPVTDEVALTWAAGISRSWVALALWNPVLIVLLAAASWLTVRNFGVPRLAAGLAAAAVALSPMVIHQLNEPQTDVPALTWVACAAALATTARTTPALLAPAVLAGGLAIGTKTTTAVTVIAALAVGVWFARAHLRRLAPLLAASLAGAVAVGGVWYLRNLIQHGSPLWPFTAAPWGDPTPHFLTLVRTSLLDRPAATLSGRWGTYAGDLAGGVALLAGLVLVALRGVLPSPLPRATRGLLLIAAGVALVAVLAWAIAPGTGVPNAPGLLFPLSWPFSTLRYLLPGLGAAALAVALAAGTGGVAGAAATLMLAASVVWSVVQDARLRFPYVPAARTLAVGAVAGVLALGALSLLVTRLRAVWPRISDLGRSSLAAARARAVVPVLAVAVIGAPLAIAANGYVERYTKVVGSTALGQDIVAWLTSQPGFESGHQPIAFAARTLSAPLAGDRFGHPLQLIAADAGCSEVRAVARRSVVIVGDPSFLRGLVGIQPYSTGQCLAGRPPAYRDLQFKLYLPTGG